MGRSVMDGSGDAAAVGKLQSGRFRRPDLPPVQAEQAISASAAAWADQAGCRLPWLPPRTPGGQRSPASRLQAPACRRAAPQGASCRRRSASGIRGTQRLLSWMLRLESFQDRRSRRAQADRTVLHPSQHARHNCNRDSIAKGLGGSTWNRRISGTIAAVAATARIGGRPLDNDADSSNRHRDLSPCVSMIFSENRNPLFANADLRFGIMLPKTRAAASRTECVNPDRNA